MDLMIPAASALLTIIGLLVVQHVRKAVHKCAEGLKCFKSMFLVHSATASGEDVVCLESKQVDHMHNKLQSFCVRHLSGVLAAVHMLRLRYKHLVLSGVLHSIRGYVPELVCEARSWM